MAPPKGGPKGAKRAPAARDAGGKRQKTTGGGAAGKRAGRGRRGGAAAEGGNGTCTCGECLEGWLTPQLADALGRAAGEAR